MPSPCDDAHSTAAQLDAYPLLPAGRGAEDLIGVSRVTTCVTACGLLYVVLAVVNAMGPLLEAARASYRCSGSDRGMCAMPPLP